MIKYLEEFLITQIEIDSNSLNYLLPQWKNGTERQKYILSLLLGKCYGYLNTLKELMELSKND